MKKKFNPPKWGGSTTTSPQKHNREFTIGKIITTDGHEMFEIIAVTKNCYDGLRFNIKSTSNTSHILKGCWLWDAGWYCIN